MIYFNIKQGKFLVERIFYLDNRNLLDINKVTITLHIQQDIIRILWMLGYTFDDITDQSRGWGMVNNIRIQLETFDEFYKIYTSCIKNLPISYYKTLGSITDGYSKIKANEWIAEIKALCQN